METLSVMNDSKSKSPEIVLCVNGYVRELEAIFKTAIPKEIIDIIIIFWPQLTIDYVGHFVQKYASCAIGVASDGLTIKGWAAAKLDEPLPISLENEGASTKWRWRAISTENADNNNVIFGVISNQLTQFDVYPWEKEMEAYGISTAAKVVFNGRKMLKDVEDCKGFKEGNHIVMEYEISPSKQCKLSFYDESNNHSFIYSINLPNDEEITSWYPVFSCSGGSIKVVPY